MVNYLTAGENDIGAPKMRNNLSAMLLFPLQYCDSNFILFSIDHSSLLPFFVSALCFFFSFSYRLLGLIVQKPIQKIKPKKSERQLLILQNSKRKPVYFENQ
jgi:hypothetical protein